MSAMVHNKVVVITGAASGIGFAIGRTFANNGAKVVISDIHRDAAEASAELLRQQGGEAIGWKADVSLEEDIVQLVSGVKETFGRIDIWINNAGMQHIAPIEHFPTEQFERMLKVMLTAPFIAIKNVFPMMQCQQFGRIINIASINGLVGFAGKSAYNSAKHGVIGLTKAAALEGAPYGITVNALCPGYVDTPLVRGQLKDLAATRNVSMENVLQEVIYPLVPQRRLLEAEEIAEYALFLASDRAKGVTGQAVVIDGGYTAQ
jgi:3-hydroxybutyrate dehydrogenase